MAPIQDLKNFIASAEGGAEKRFTNGKKATCAAAEKIRSATGLLAQFFTTERAAA